MFKNNLTEAGQAVRARSHRLAGGPASLATVRHETRAPASGQAHPGRLGIRRAGEAGVDIELVSFKSGRRARLDSKTLSKVLHLAMFHGWKPERLAAQPPSASWDTEIIVPYIEPYLFGSVSDPDAANLVRGLKRMLESEALGLQLPVLFAAAAIVAIAENGSFGIVTESVAGAAIPANAQDSSQPVAPQLVSST